MKLIIIVIFLLLINPIYANDSNISDLDSLLEYYNPETLKSKPLSKITWTSSKGETLNRAIDKEIAQQVLHADYKYYDDIFPGEIILKNENIIGLNYILICGAGGFCEYEKLVILKNNGEFIDDFEFGKYLADSCGRLIKENVYRSDSLMIFKTSDIEINPQNDSISSIKIEMQTINISDKGEITVVDKNKIDTRRKYYWISTDVVQDSTLAKYSKSKLAEMRYEVFASHGYIFKSEKWRNYFESEDWYEARFENVNESLTVIERMNIQKILNYEKLESNWQK
ncbi:MAG: YARHG domain-containing protein, partial [Armatimonadetes bacterium]|nr:YARHG domain-containing protein [Armatimonadota bacterium]